MVVQYLLLAHLEIPHDSHLSPSFYSEPIPLVLPVRESVEESHPFFFFGTQTLNPGRESVEENNLTLATTMVKQVSMQGIA